MPSPHSSAVDAEDPFARLVAEAEALVRARQFADAATLLERAADGVVPPADATRPADAPPDVLARDALPAVRAVQTVRRAIGAYLRELAPPPSGRVLRDLMERAGGLTPAVIDRAREHSLDGRRFAYTADGCDAYLQIIRGFALAALDARRRELARRILQPALALLRFRTEFNGEFSAEASFALAFARIAAGASAPAQAYLVAEDVRRRCEHAPGGAKWSAAARVAVGIARLALRERDEGRRLVREALAALPASGQEDSCIDGLNWLYEADLDAFDADGALACTASLAALGYAGGTSRREIDARLAERTDADDAIARYSALLNDPAEREPGQGVTPETAWRVALRLGRLLVEAGQFGTAYELLDFYYRPLLDERDADDPLVTELDELLADLELAVGRPQYALPCLSRATARDSRLASRQLAVGTSRQRQALLAGPRRRADASVALAAELASDDAELVGGVFAIVTQRKGLNTNIEWQAMRDVAAQAAHDPDVAALSQQQAAVRARITREALELTRRVSAGDASGDVGRLDAYIREEDALTAELVFRAGGISVEDHTEAPNPLSIAMCIPEESVYVDYVRCQPPRRSGESAPRPPRYVAFIVPARTMAWRVLDLGEAAPIDALVVQFRAGITGASLAARDIGLDAVNDAVNDADSAAGVGGADGDPTSPGVRLRQRVFDPLVPLFDGRTRLIVAPDGSLWTLPLECLPTDLGEPLLAQYGISYVSSARSAAVMHADRAPEPRSPAHGPPRSSALVIGAPDYDLPRAASTAAASTAAASTAAASTAASAALADSAFRFGPLPGTRDEACAVADVFGVEPTLGAAATTACVRGARDPLAVHFATHGFALDASAAGGRLAGAPLLRTGLALAGANARAMDGDDAGVLTADEVASLNLRATALVVLSACKTGLGEIEYGEGLASLARSFEAAGAACVIAGLWSVPDAETRDLMTAFYRRLTPECGVADALRQAKLELWRRHGDVRGWGAFVCTGAWGPVTLRPLDAPGAAALG